VTRRLIETSLREARGPRPPAPQLSDLTERKLAVLQLTAHGMSNAEIADARVVSHSTANTRVAHVCAKLGVRDRVQAGVVTPGAGSPDHPAID